MSPPSLVSIHSCRHRSCCRRFHHRSGPQEAAAFTSTLATRAGVGGSECSSEGSGASSDLETMSMTVCLQVDFSPTDFGIIGSSPAAQHWLGIDSRSNAAKVLHIFADPERFRTLFMQHCQAVSEASVALPYTSSLGLLRFQGRRRLRKPWAQVWVHFYDPEDCTEEQARHDLFISIRMVRVSDPRGFQQGSPALGLEQGSLQPSHQMIGRSGESPLLQSL
mmetsp:Transcript_28991/g.93082  ORF Transcript_28991/g.93082 Transcript_28991/m.93082 type:complete len:221 (-) Transcript_28991:121-783(-)